MPKGYIVGRVNLSDAEAYKPYAARNNELLPRYGGKFLVRGGAADYLEGAGESRHVIIEFPSYEKALAFYNDPDYQENMKIRQAHSEGSIVIMGGVE